MKLPLFHGSIVALITPMIDGKVDYDSLKNLVEHHIKAGTHAIVAVGTTGESPTLPIAEHIEVVKKCVEFAKGRIPIIAGAGSNCTASAINTCKSLENEGVVGFLSVAPYYNKPTQEGLYQHYKTIAQSTKLPVILYNVPSRTVSDIQPEMVARLAKIDNIVGIKEATGDLSRLAKIKELAGNDFIFLSGDDATGFDSIVQGGQGVISVTNNVKAQEMAQMCELALSGQIDEAKRINDSLMDFHKKLFIEPNPTPVKWVAFKQGLISSPSIRLPLLELSDEGKKVIEEIL